LFSFLSVTYSILMGYPLSVPFLVVREEYSVARLRFPCHRDAPDWMYYPEEFLS
jgi:hypothetical protein